MQRKTYQALFEKEVEYVLWAKVDDGTRNGNNDGTNEDQGKETDDGTISENTNIELEGKSEADEIGDDNYNTSPLSTNPYTPKPDESDHESNRQLAEDAEVIADICVTSATIPPSSTSSLSTSTSLPLKQQVDVEDATVKSSTMAFIRSEDSGIVDHLTNKRLKQEEEVRKQKERLR